MWLNNSSLGPAEQFITGQITAAIGIKCGKGCLDVLDGLVPAQSGRFLAFDGEMLPW
jgi:hypothetical protein